MNNQNERTNENHQDNQNHSACRNIRLGNQYARNRYR